MTSPAATPEVMGCKKVGESDTRQRHPRIGEGEQRHDEEGDLAGQHSFQLLRWCRRAMAPST